MRSFFVAPANRECNSSGTLRSLQFITFMVTSRSALVIWYSIVKVDLTSSRSAPAANWFQQSIPLPFSVSNLSYMQRFSMSDSLLPSVRFNEPHATSAVMVRFFNQLVVILLRSAFFDSAATELPPDWVQTVLLPLDLRSTLSTFHGRSLGFSELLRRLLPPASVPAIASFTY